MKLKCKTKHILVDGDGFPVIGVTPHGCIFMYTFSTAGAASRACRLRANNEL